jgi:hypothetical protein
MLLKPKAFAILRHLVDHAGRLVTQEELLEAIWPDTYVQPEVLKRHIFELRKELGDQGNEEQGDLPDQGNGPPKVPPGCERRNTPLGCPVAFAKKLFASSASLRPK